MLLYSTIATYYSQYFKFSMCTKGQLISKCLFGAFNFLQKTNENKSHSSKIEFVRSFYGGNVSLKKSFRLFLTFSPPLLLLFYFNFLRSKIAQKHLTSYVHGLFLLFIIHKAVEGLGSI